MNEKCAFLFPGQGSQAVGMGQEFAERFPEAKEVFYQADQICGKPISRLCFQGPMEDLTITENLQPAVTSVNLAALKALNQSGVHAGISAGHSLGEFSALVSAGAMTAHDALRLVKKRGELMHRESQINPGGMAAVMGLDLASVQEIVDQVRDGDVLAVANHNTADQIVITGEKEALSRALKRVKESKGKAIPLKVSGAWHCDLMSHAVADFRRFMEEVSLGRPSSGILFNATAEGETQPEKIKDLMAHQLVSPVRWYDIISRMKEKGIQTFVEVGPKKVLSGLARKILSQQDDVKIFNVEDGESLDAFLNEMN